MFGTRNMSGMISINDNFLNPPDIQSTFFNPDENQNRMAKFFGTSAARKTLLGFYEGVNARRSRTFLITGRRGYGKTNLGLLITNFFCSEEKSDTIALIKEKMGPKIPVEDMKKEIGKFLFVNPKLPAPGKDLENFGAVIIDALQHAFVQNGLTTEIFSSSDTKKVFKQATDYLKNTGVWNGIFIAADDIEPLMMDIENFKSSSYSMQAKKFFKFIGNIEDFPVIFVGIGSIMPAVYESRVIEDEARESLKLLFNEIFYIDYTDEEWVDLVCKNIFHNSSVGALEILTTNVEFERLAQSIYDSGIYSDYDMEHILHKMIPACFPLHPFTLYLLPKISQITCTRQNSLFGFFSDRSGGSLQYFMDTFGVFQSPGKISLYTPDYLYAYFEKTIKKSPHLSHINEAVKKAYAHSGKQPLAYRIIRLTALLQIINDENLRPTKQNLIDSLMPDAKEKNVFEALLFEMVNDKVLCYDSKNQEVSLPAKPAEFDIRELTLRRIKRFQAIIHPRKIMEDSQRLKTVFALRYNKKHKTDRKMVQNYLNMEDLADDILPGETDLGTLSPRYVGDVGVYYLMTNDEEEVKFARQNLIQPRWDKRSRVVVAIPSGPLEFLDLLYKKKVLSDLIVEPLLEDKESTQFKYVDEQLKEVESQLQKQLKTFITPKLFDFYYNQTILEYKGESAVDLANFLMDIIFSKYPVLKNPAVSRFHDREIYQKTRKSACHKLLCGKGRLRVSKIPTSDYDKLLNALFVKQNLLKKTGETGDYGDYCVSKLQETDNTLKEIWQKIFERFEECCKMENQVVNVFQFFKEFLEPPYGVNPSLIEMLLSAVFYNFSVEVDVFSNYVESQKKHDHSLLTRIPLDFETIRRIVKTPEDIIIYFSEYPSEEKLFVRKIIEIFAQKVASETKEPPWDEGKYAILHWYRSLPGITRSNRDFKEPKVRAFRDLLENEASTAAPQKFFQEMLPGALGYDPMEFSYKTHVLEILEDIKKIYLVLFRHSKIKEAILFKAVKTVFAGKDPDFEKRLSAWVNKVPADIGNRLSHEAMTIASINLKGDLEKQFLYSIPEKIGISSFGQWDRDKTYEYLARLSKAKLEVDISEVSAAFKIPSVKGPKNETARHIFEDIFARFNINRKEQELFVIDLMEKSVWA